MMADGLGMLDRDQRCVRCPAPQDARCPGRDVRRFCELIDPACPQYEPGYLDVIVRQSSRPGDDADVRLAGSYARDPGRLTEVRVEGLTVTANCCPGAVPPGVYEHP